MFGKGRGWSTLGSISSNIKSRSDRSSKIFEGLPSYDQQSIKDQDAQHVELRPQKAIARRDQNIAKPPVSMGLLKAFRATRDGVIPFAQGAYQPGDSHDSSQQSQFPSSMMGITSDKHLAKLRQLELDAQRVPEDMYGRKDWEQHFKRWKDIGKQYKKKGIDVPWIHILRRQPLPAVPKEEEEFCLTQGIKFEKKLGEGGYGAVWLTSKGNQKYACKIIDLITHAPQSNTSIILNKLCSYGQQMGMLSGSTKVTVASAVKELLAEADIHRILNHRNIVRCEHIVHLHDQITGFPHCRLLIFMELCEGDLGKVIKSSSQKKLTEGQTKEMFIDVCSGLKYLHDQNIFHFDIKPQNIMFVTEGGKRVYKLADFGLSKKFDSEYATLNFIAGTYLYMAPEMANNKPGQVWNGKATDIFSLGCVLAESLIGSYEWHKFVNDIQDSQLRPYLFQFYGITEECGDLIARMTTLNPGSRPTIDQIFNSTWLTFSNT